MTDPAGEQTNDSARYPAAPAEPTTSPSIPTQVTSSMQWPAAPPVPQPASQPPGPQGVPQPSPGGYGYGVPVTAGPPLTPASTPPPTPPMPLTPPPTPPAAKPATRGWRTSTTVLTILSAVLLLGAAAMTTLFIMQKREADRLSAQVVQLTGETTERQDRIDALQRDLEDTKRDLTDSRNEADQIDTERKALVDCLNASLDAGREAANSGETSAAYKAKAEQAEKLCVEAFRYL